MEPTCGETEGLATEKSASTARQRTARAVAWLLLAAATAKFCYRGPWRAFQSSTDLALYYASARAWVEGSNPYDPENLRAVAARAGGAPATLLRNAISPPVTLVPLAPLTLLSWREAQAVWLAANLLLTAGMCWLLVRLASLRPTSTGGLLLLAMVLALAPLHTGLKHGQMALASTALLVGAVGAQWGGRGVGAGVLLALAGVFKPQLAAAFGLYWICRRRWRAVLTAAVVVGAVTLVALLRLHWAEVAWWPQWRANIEACFYGGDCDHTVAGQAHIFIHLQHPLYAILGSRAAATWLGWAVTAVLAAAGVAAWRRTPETPGRELTVLAFLGVICLLPVYHIFYDAVVLVLPLCWAVRALGTRQKRWAIATIVLALPFLVSGAAALHVLAKTGRVPAHWASSWWWRALLLPHQPYLLLAMGIVLALALRSEAKEAATRL